MHCTKTKESRESIMIDQSLKANLPHGGKILVDQLLLHNVRRVFSVPGESYLNVLDGLYDTSIENVVCRNESGASFMAEAHGKLTGKPGIAFVTRGPGATNASGGIHTASQDSTPMILFIGQVKSDHLGRGAFQEIDYDRFFGSMCKRTFIVRDLDDIQRSVKLAFRISQDGCPGPVAVALPENVLNLRGVVEPLGPDDEIHERKRHEDGISEEFEDWLSTGQRPLIVVGGPIWSKGATSMLTEFAETYNIPVATTFRRQDRFDNRHPNYAGDLTVGINPELAQRVKECDRLLLLGTRFGDVPSNGYTLIEQNGQYPSICSVSPAPVKLYCDWARDLAIICKPETFLVKLNQAGLKIKPLGQNWLVKCQKSYKNWVEPKTVPGDVQFPKILKWLSDNLPVDAIVTNGAGNYAAFLHRFYQPKQYPTQIAPTSGSMGYGLPAAIAAKLEHPAKLVICFAGDGCFQMTLSEMSTAAQYQANVVVIIANNGMYGTIRMHQERQFPGRVSGTDLHNPNYVALAQAYEWHGERVKHTDEFPRAFERCVQAKRPSLIELKLDPEAITPDTTIGSLRGQPAV